MNINPSLALIVFFSSYLFSQTHTITATFGANGKIVPSGVVQVNEGDSVQFRIIPDIGYKFVNVTIDGAYDEFAWSTYTFKNVTSNHTISSNFKKSQVEGYTTREQRHLWKTGDPVPENTLSPDDLEYKGAFRLPGRESQTGIWAYGGNDFAFYPDGDKGGPDDGYPGSLFGIGNVNDYYCSEISIPNPVISRNIADLNTAQTLQPFKLIYSGANVNLNEIHGIEYLPVQKNQSSANLYFGLGPTYVTAGNHRYANHGWCDINLSSPLDVLWFVGDSELSSAQTGYYMFDIPQEIANELDGRCLTTGRYRAGQGYGPHLFAISPWDQGNPPADKAILTYLPLLNYGTTDSTALADCRYNDFYSGIAWATCGTKSAVLFSAFMGYGAIWYDHKMLSDSSLTGIKFFNPKDLVDVAKGKKKPYGPKPYATLDVTHLLYSNQYKVFTSATDKSGLLYRSGALRGGAFDREHSILYVTEVLAEDESRPIIHVWKIKKNSESLKLSPHKKQCTFNIYPNKSKRELTINFSFPKNIFINDKSLKMSIYNLQGKRLFNKVFPQFRSSVIKTVVNTSEWGSGTYTCEVDFEGCSYYEKIVVQ